MSRALIRTVSLLLIATALVAISAVFPTTQPFTHRPVVVGPPPFEPHSLTWNLATSSAEWEPRDSGTAFLFKDRMWLVGGLNGNGHVDSNRVEHYWEAPHFNDIWSSTDGATWTLESAHAEFPPRRSMSIVYFKGALWMIGGYSSFGGLQSDIWKSFDAVHWQKVADRADFTPREGQTIEEFSGRLWLTGGVNYDKRKVFNDVWYSDDAIHWTQATAAAPWAPRWDHDTEVFNGKLYLAEGMDQSLKNFNDVWATEDGFTWSLVTAHAPWETRQGGQLSTYQNRLWVLGRVNDAVDGYGPNDIWYTSDGANWEKTALDAPFSGREDYAALVYHGGLYVFTGMDATMTWTNDVWVARATSTLATINAPKYLLAYVGKDGRETVLASLNDRMEHPLASITKLMLALVINDHYTPRDRVVVSARALDTTGPAHVYHPGDTFTYDAALHALLVASHNEIATALAEPLGVDSVVQEMNARATALGMTATRYQNVNGLDPAPGKKANYSTAQDLFALAKHVTAKTPELLSVGAATHYTLSSVDGTVRTDLVPTNKLLERTDLPFSIVGGKTGETPSAGQNLLLVTEAPCGGKLYTIVLGSEHSFDDVFSLLTFASQQSWRC